MTGATVSRAPLSTAGATISRAPLSTAEDTAPGDPLTAAIPEPAVPGTASQGLRGAGNPCPPGPCHHGGPRRTGHLPPLPG